MPVDFARYRSQSPLASLLGGFSSATQGTNIGKEIQQAQQTRQKNALQNVLMQQQQEKLKEMPQSFATSQGEAKTHGELLKHQIANAKFIENKNKHSLITSQLASLAGKSEEAKRKGYQAIRKNAVEKMGLPGDIFPAQYNQDVELDIQKAYGQTIAGIAKEKMGQQMALERYKALLKQGVHPGTLVGGSYISTGEPTNQGTVQPPLGAQPSPGVSTPSPDGTVAPGTQSAAQDTQPSPPGQLRITPSPGVQMAYEKKLGEAFVAKGTEASDIAQQAHDAIGDIDTFTREAPKVSIGTGFGKEWIGGHLDEAGNQARKASNRLTLALAKMAKFGKITNYEMKILKAATLNLGMKPAAWKALAPQLKAIAERQMEYSRFYNQLGKMGLRDPMQINDLWSQYISEHPAVNAKTGKVHKENMGRWREYTSQQRLRKELLGGDTSQTAPKQSSNIIYTDKSGKGWTREALLAEKARRQAARGPNV